MQLLEKLTFWPMPPNTMYPVRHPVPPEKEIQAPSAPQLNQESVTRLLRMAAVFHC